MSDRTSDDANFHLPHTRKVGDSVRIHLANEAAQVDFGGRLARGLDYQGIVFLIGDLGAGKTTLTRGVLHSLGYSGAVKSPTYTLLEPYEVNHEHIYHYDLYRLGDPEELEFIGGRDLLSSQGLHMIEWPSRGEGWLPTADLMVRLSVVDEGRVAEIEAGTERGARVLSSIEHNDLEVE